MSTPGRTAASAVGATLAVLLAALLPFSLLAGPARGSGASDGPFEVTGAQLRWGINNESNNRAFAPGTYNFFSAGIVPDPGRGGTTLPPSSWRAVDGTVRIEKQQPDGSWAAATWAGLSTTAQGATIASPTSGEFSNHQVVLDAGTGTVDPATGFATISWKGSFTVLFYSGMSYFTVTDPALSVTPERAQLTATIGGFASDMDDQSQWNPLPPTQVVLADLPRDQVDLASADGFASTPAYLGVGWQPPADEAAQVGGPWKGAFPASFLDVVSSAGTAGYWYSTGGATDAYKPPLPLTVSWAGTPVATPTASAPVRPTATPTKNPTKSPTRAPTTSPTSPSTTPASSSPAPTSSAPAPVTGSTPAPDVGSSTGPGAPPGSASGELDDGQVGLAAAAPLAVQPLLVSATPSPPATAAPAAADTESHALWWLGCVLLLGALATTLISTSLVSTSLEGKR
jgi:hypothetical protein